MFKMKLNKGWIYSIYYSNWREDPNPLVLVLFSGKDKTHCLNLTYLSPALTERVINMLGLLATKKLSYRKNIRRHKPCAQAEKNRCRNNPSAIISFQ